MRREDATDDGPTKIDRTSSAVDNGTQTTNKFRVRVQIDRPGMWRVKRARRPLLLFGLVALVVMPMALAWVVVSRRHRSSLIQVDREIAARRYSIARQHLIGLATRWMGPDEVDYRLGLCEGNLGNDEAALAAWGRLSAWSPFAEAAALNSAAVEFNRGRFAAAESILEGRTQTPRSTGYHGRPGPVPAPVGTRANL